MKDRYIIVEKGHGYFIDNTILHSTPPGGSGLLVAYTRNPKKKLEESRWNLGVLLNLHPKETTIDPLICKDNKSNKIGAPWDYFPTKNVEVFNVFDDKVRNL